MSYKITDTIIVDNNKNIASIGTALFAGPVIIGGGTSTGTVSQPLQVTGTNGAYIGGNLGIGSTNPSSKLWVSGDIYNAGVHTAYVLNASKDPGTGIATDFTNSLFGNGWRVSSPGSTTYYKLATLPPGGGGNTFDHLIINGVLGAWTNGNQTPFEITFSNRGSFNYKYVSYGSVRSDVRIIGISTNSSVEIWAQHQASQFTKLVYNIPNSIESIVVSNPTSTTTAPTGTTVFDSSTATPRFIINESDYVGIGTATPQSALDVRGTITVGVGAVGINSVFSTTDIQSWQYTNKSKYVGADGDTSPQAIYVGAAGTAMFMVGSSGNDVNQYTLSTPYDVSTAGAPVGVCTVTTQETAPLGIDFNPTGTKMFISGNVAAQPGLIPSGEYVHEYLLSTAWTVSTAGYTTSFNITQDNAPGGVTFGNSGSKMYVVGSGGDAVYQYSLSTPYSLASGSVTYDSISLILGSSNPLVLETLPTDISFNSTGTVLWVVGYTNDRIYEFRLGTAWDISTAVFYDDVYIGFNEITVTGLHVIPQQNVAYIVGSSSDTVFQYSTNTPALEIASSGISTESSIILNNETRVKNRLYVKGDILTQGTLTVTGASTLTGNVTASGTLTVSGGTITAGNVATGLLGGNTTTNINFGTGLTSGTLVIGNNAQTGTLTLGTATVSQTTNIQAGVSLASTTKTINFGTGGLSGSFTQINIGPTAGVGTVVINSGTNLLVGTTTSTGTAAQRLQVDGGAYVSGNLGVGNTNPQNTLDVGVGTIRLINKSSTGRFSQIYQDNELIFSNSSTNDDFSWTNGSGSRMRLYGAGNLVIPGTFTPTGTASQRLQVDGGVYVSGNLGVGNTNGEGIKLFVSQGNPAANRSVALITDDGTIPTMTSGATLRISNDGSGNTFALLEAESNAGRLVFTNAGNLGIGTTNPGATLNVVPTASSIAGLFSGTTSSDMVRITQLGSGNALVVEDETPEGSPFVVTGLGTVGIGITNPTIKLTVNGGLDSSNRQVRFVNSGSGDLYIKHANLVSSIEAGSSVQLALGGNGAEVVRIKSTGVGIGTTNPQDTLDVGIGTIRLYNKSIYTTRFSQIYQDGALNFKNSNGGDDFNFLVGGTTLMKLYGSGPLGINTTSLTGTSSQLLQVNSGAYVSGSVGIGITNPEKLLHLSTSVATPLIIQRTTAGNSAIEYRNTTSSMWAGIPTNAAGWGVGPTENVGTGAQILVTRTGGELLVGRLTATGTASQLLQVDGGAYVSGSVGIGTTNPTEKLQVQGNISINGTTSYGSTTATTATVSQIGIHSGISTSTYRSVEYTIQATEGTNFHATKILSIHNGTTAYNSEYGTIYNNTSVGTFDVDVSGGNIRLLVTPASSSSTTYTINFVATKI